MDYPDTYESDGHAAAERDAERLALEATQRPREPDVFVDLPQLRVEGVNLEVADLWAKVSLNARVLDLLDLRLGAEASLGRVKVEVERVEVQAQVKVRLDDLAAILDRVLATIDRNPQIIERLVAGVGGAVERVGEGAGQAVGELGEGASSAVEDVGRGAGSAVRDVGEGAGTAVSEVGEGARSAVEDVGEGAGSAVEDVGGGAGSAVRDVGEGAESTAENLTGGSEESE